MTLIIGDYNVEVTEDKITFTGPRNIEVNRHTVVVDRTILYDLSFMTDYWSDMVGHKSNLMLRALIYNIHGIFKITYDTKYNFITQIGNCNISIQVKGFRRDQILIVVLDVFDIVLIGSSVYFYNLNKCYDPRFIDTPDIIEYWDRLWENEYCIDSLRYIIGQGCILFPTIADTIDLGIIRTKRTAVLPADCALLAVRG